MISSNWSGSISLSWHEWSSALPAVTSMVCTHPPHGLLLAGVPLSCLEENIGSCLHLSWGYSFKRKQSIGNRYYLNVFCKGPFIGEHLCQPQN